MLLFLELFHTQKQEYKQGLLKTMQVCSYTFKCEQFTFDFSPKKGVQVHQLYEDSGLYSYFSIPKSEKYYLKISYTSQAYYHDMKDIKETLWIKFILATVLLFILALFFTFYSLKPIRKAIRLNDEFIKDIVHDFNTPITAMVLNIKMFKEEYANNIFTEKISYSIDNILHLQNNLKSFLYRSVSQNVQLDIAALAKKRLELMQNLYPKLDFVYEKESELMKVSNEDMLVRILDNLLSNAAKYNKVRGEVKLKVSANKIIISDTGKGIKNPKKALERYYKEQERGLGLGLHIVKKFTEELHIMMHIESTVDVATEVTLDFSALKKELS